MLHGQPTKDDYAEVVDRLTSKLASWKGRLLNKLGRVVLANSVLSTMPAYGMQLHWYLENVCQVIDKTIRSFIWRGHNDSGMHMVGWSKITKPKRHGGLGVRVARHQNIALLGKRIWDLLHEKEKLWVHMLSICVGGECVFGRRKKRVTYVECHLQGHDHVRGWMADENRGG